MNKIISLVTALSLLTSISINTSSNVIAEDILDIAISDSQNNQYEVSINLNSENIINFKENDYVYLFVTAEKDNNQNIYYIQQLIGDFNNSNFLIQNTKESHWLDNNGNASNETITSNDKLTIELLKSTSPKNVNNLIQKTDCYTIENGSIFQGNTVEYNANYIKFSPITSEYKYDYKTILGKALKYGIVADRFEQSNHAQTNFATNYYDPNDAQIDSDLSGKNGGHTYASNFVDFNGKTTIDSSTRFPTINEPGGKIFIGESHCENGQILHVDNADRLRDKRDFVTVKIDTPDNMTNNVIEPMLNYNDEISNSIINNESNIDTVKYSGANIIIDSTYYGDNDTIFVDGDTLAKLSDGYIGGALTINMKPNQTIIFNFDETNEVTLGTYYISYNGESRTKVDSCIINALYEGGEKNIFLDEATRHIIWNMNSVKNLNLDASAGIFLLPNEESITTITGTTTGWIVSDGYIKNVSGEWHYVFSGDTEATASISKVAITGGSEIGGASLKVVDANNIVIDEWVSVENESHNITGLEAGNTYTLIETNAPDGYIYSENIDFTVNNDGTVTFVEMIDETTSVTFSKQDTNNKEIGGAQLTVFDYNDNSIIDSWISIENENHIISGELAVDTVYVLKETNAPLGYEIADEIYFILEKDGNLLVSNNPNSNFTDSESVIMIDEAIQTTTSTATSTTSNITTTSTTIKPITNITTTAVKPIISTSIINSTTTTKQSTSTVTSTTNKSTITSTKPITTTLTTPITTKRPGLVAPDDNTMTTTSTISTTSTYTSINSNTNTNTTVLVTTTKDIDILGEGSTTVTNNSTTTDNSTTTNILTVENTTSSAISTKTFKNTTGTKVNKVQQVTSVAKSNSTIDSSKNSSPKTGDSGIAGTVIALFSSITTMFIVKRKRED